LVVLFALVGCNGSPAQASLSPRQDLGRRLFSQHCASCHATSTDIVISGPALARIASSAGNRILGMDAYAYLEQSILQPSAFITPGFKDLMPKTFPQILISDDLEALISYLLTFD
jgi:cytochrome c551/c552